MQAKAKENVRILTECSIMIALSTVLSVIKLFEMPYGGSITLASMLPVAVIAHRHGFKYGISTALVASVIQLLLGLKNFSYFTTPESLVALGVFDYILAFGVFGLVGLMKRWIRSQSLAATVGVVLASLLRYLCHVISGATIWAGLSIPTEAAMAYSLSYNATYMVPETIILVLTTVYLTSSLDFTRKTPARLRTEKLDPVSAWCYAGAGLAVLASLITDTVLVFSKLQNYDSGEFMIMGLAEVDWLLVAIVTAVALALAAVLVIIAKSRKSKA
ncbi:MAG: energy-coupled thiamine transporter ThiT [Clostridia bacterium]|nr:energy-coupled thiamine transporter ThiT [Clostridia bacterium]